MSKKRTMQSRPNLEPLEGRRLTAAIGTVLITQPAEIGQTDAGDGIAKVRIQDISFRSSVSKSSPMLS